MRAPARLIRRVGALSFAAVFAAACESGTPDEGPRVLELAHDTIRLQQGVRLHDVDVERSRTEFDPVRIEAESGDVVRFTAGDGAGHVVVFEGTRMSGDVRAWLEQTAQMRGPPLLSEGAAWVITLEGAPAGEYPFRCATHSAAGVLHVTAAP